MFEEKEKDGNFPQEERTLLVQLLNILDPVKPTASLDKGEEVPRHAKAIRRVLGRHSQRLQQEIQLANLRSYLFKHGVLSQEEYDELMELAPEQRNEELLSKILKKTNTAVVAFHRCLKESQKHAKLAELFDQEMESTLCRFNALPHTHTHPHIDKHTTTKHTHTYTYINSPPTKHTHTHTYINTPPTKRTHTHTHT